jgi:hypothetical protein
MRRTEADDYGPAFAVEQKELFQTNFDEIHAAGLYSSVNTGV